VLVLHDEEGHEGKRPWLDAVTSALEEMGIAWVVEQAGSEMGVAPAGWDRVVEQAGLGGVVELAGLGGGVGWAGLGARNPAVVVLATKNPAKLSKTLGSIPQPVVVLPQAEDPAAAVEVAKEAASIGSRGGDPAGGGGGIATGDPAGESGEAGVGDGGVGTQAEERAGGVGNGGVGGGSAGTRLAAGAVGVNVARNAGLAAARIIGAFDPEVEARLEQLATKAATATKESDQELQER